MKTFISRLLLLAAGLLCLSGGTPAQSQNASDSTKIMTIREALKNAPKKSDKVIIKATYDDAVNLILPAIKPNLKWEENYNLIFNYDSKSFILLSDGENIKSSKIYYTGAEKDATKESSNINYEKIRKNAPVIVIFNPNATDK